MTSNPISIKPKKLTKGEEIQPQSIGNDALSWPDVYSPPSTLSRMWHEVIFRTKYNWFEFRKQPSLPYYVQRENRWIHPFPKGISAKWNLNSLVQSLNSGHWFHFL